MAKSIKNKLVHYANRQVELAKKMAVLQQERAELERVIKTSKPKSTAATKAAKRLLACQKEYAATKKEFNKIQKQIENL